jgi:hypothetical protein
MTFGRVMATASNNSSSRVVKKSLRFHELEDQEFLIDNFLWRSSERVASFLSQRKQRLFQSEFKPLLDRFNKYPTVEHVIITYRDYHKENCFNLNENGKPYILAELTLRLIIFCLSIYSLYTSTTSLRIPCNNLLIFLINIS